MGGVTARSDWSTSATFVSFMSGRTSTIRARDTNTSTKGSIAIERNKNPLVVNPDAWLTHEPNGGSDSWTVTYNDDYGNFDADPTLGNRTLLQRLPSPSPRRNGKELSNLTARAPYKGTMARGPKSAASKAPALTSSQSASSWRTLPITGPAESVPAPTPQRRPACNPGRVKSSTCVRRSSWSTTARQFAAPRSIST